MHGKTSRPGDLDTYATFQYQVELATEVARHDDLRREIKELQAEFLDIKTLLQKLQELSKNHP